jgi:hypothetical protein
VRVWWRNSFRGPCQFTKTGFYPVVSRIPRISFQELFVFGNSRLCSPYNVIRAREVKTREEPRVWIRLLGLLKMRDRFFIPVQQKKRKAGLSVSERIERPQHQHAQVFAERLLVLFQPDQAACEIDPGGSDRRRLFSVTLPRRYFPSFR